MEPISDYQNSTDLTQTTCLCVPQSRILAGRKLAGRE